MFKIKYYLLLLIIFFYIFPLYNSSDDNTNEINEDTLESDPLKNFDFGSLIWLDDTNVTSEIKKHELLYIVFYIPTCPHCQKFLPEYVAAANLAKEKNMTIKFAKINARKSRNTSLEFDLQEIPSVFLMYKGEKYFYSGERSKENLLKFVNKKINNDIYEVETLSEIKKYMNSSSSLVLLSTLRQTNTVLYQSFLNYSKISANIDFLTCKSDECLNEYKEDIILFKNFDEKINKYSVDVGNIAEAKPDSVREFAATYGFEAGAKLNGTQISMMFEHKRKMLFYFRNSLNKEQTKYDKLIKEMGKYFRKKKIYTVVSDIKGEPIQQDIASTFVIVRQDLPAICFYDLRRNGSEDEYSLFYSLREVTNKELNKEYIKDYIDKVLNGTIREDLFSEPPLENYNINGLKYIIGRTFDKEIVQEKKNVILTLIGSEPNYETERVLNIMRNLTKIYNSDEKNIVFAYMDIDKNQPRDINIEEEKLPLILLYPNAMIDKTILKINHPNMTEISQAEIEYFLNQTFNWGNKTEDGFTVDEEIVEEKKEGDNVQKEEKKEKEKEKKKEEKKESQTDL